ncbi:MAG: hypothetical protein GF365_03525 [Candidatus Buchananbacteria bacterium]|nr:hypothetical protein [Candidatus Buchananbacteria bacterium]
MVDDMDIYESIIRDGFEIGKEKRKKREEAIALEKKKELEQEEKDKEEKKRMNNRFAHIFFLELQLAISEQISFNKKGSIKIYLMSYPCGDRYTQRKCFCWISEYGINKYKKRNYAPEGIREYNLNFEEVSDTIQRRLKKLGIKFEIKKCKAYKFFCTHSVDVTSEKVFILDLESCL